MFNLIRNDYQSLLLVYFFAIIGYPIMGILLLRETTPLFESMPLRFVISFILAAAVGSTLVFPHLKNRLKELTVYLCFVLAAHTVVMVYFNDFAPVYFIILVIFVMAVGVIFKPIHFLIFSIIALTPLLYKLYYVSAESLVIPANVLIYMLFTTFITSFVISWFSSGFVNEMRLAKEVIEKGQMNVAVFTPQAQRQYSNLRRLKEDMEPYYWEKLKLRFKSMDREPFEFAYKNQHQIEKWSKWNSVSDNNNLIYMGHDITESKHKEKAMEDFAFVVSHDLKAPLRNMSSLLDFLIEDYAPSIDPDGKELIDTMKLQVAKMNLLIGGILSYSGISNTEPQFEKVDLNNVLSEAKQMTNKAGFLHISSSKLPTVIGDKVKLLQVFINLIDNAIKYACAGDPKLHIQHSRFGQRNVISFKDNGPGVPVEVSEKIFEIFKTGYQNKMNSAGIGLSTVKKCVTQHGGDVWLDTSTQQGANFIVSLPINHT